MISSPNTVSPVQDLLSHLNDVMGLSRPCLQFVICPLNRRINWHMAFRKTSLKISLLHYKLWLVMHSVTLSEPLP